MSRVDEERLLEAWRAGDVEAGNLLFTRHFDAVARFFENKSPEAEDLVQATFLACVRARDRLREGVRLRAYLLGVAYRILLRHWRDRYRRPIDLRITSLQDLGPTPSRALSRARTDAELIEALRRIPLELQIVLQMHVWEELTAREIGHALALPEGTVRTRLRRGRQLLRQSLGRKRLLRSAA